MICTSIIDMELAKQNHINVVTEKKHAKNVKHKA